MTPAVVILALCLTPACPAIEAPIPVTETLEPGETCLDAALRVIAEEDAVRLSHMICDDGRKR